MKFLLLAVAALAQFQRRGSYGRQQRGKTQVRRRPQFGRFGGHTDVNRRDARYGTNHRVGRYGGYTRKYDRNANNGRGGFDGRRDPFRADPNDNRRGYNPYRNHQQRGQNGQDRLGSVCKQLTAQTAERECGTYTGRMGCEATCAKLRDEAGNYNRFQRRGRRGRRGRTQRYTGRGRTQQRYNPYQRMGGKQTRYNPFQRRGATKGRYTRGRTGRRQIRIPTQGGVFGRRGRKTQKYGRKTGGMQRGFGRNGIMGNRLGQMGRNRMQPRQ